MVSNGKSMKKLVNNYFSLVSIRWGKRTPYSIEPAHARPNEHATCHSDTYILRDLVSEQKVSKG